ncbi:zinc metalloprotease HtpX [candidate division KSB1 bacterium]|nr:zinc metalloprotease HtpX [candidate division KSB1 bacterium]RQW01730.1 MAG: zinc metalloprotease HtpX [candidate division KSB1 bacterium]
MQNNIKTFLLMAVLTVLFVWIGGEIGGQQGALIAFVIAAAINFYSYWFSDKLVLHRYKGHEVGQQDDSRLYRIVEELSKKANLPMPRVFLIPDRTPNAFATGRNPQHAAVAATEGILQLLSDDELQGVMAHELAHVQHRDILIGTVAATFAGAIAMLGQLTRYSAATQQKRQNPISAIFILVGAPLAAMLIRMTISRVREYSADAGGAEISGKPLGLANALNKLQQGVAKYPMTNGNPAHSHLFIVNPFFGGIQKLFSTHPPIEERIRRLEEMSKSMQF